MTSLINVSEILICPWTRLWWMGAIWLNEHKQNHKKSSLKLLVRFWNNLIEIFLEWPFSELFLKFWSVNKHGISEWRLLALYRHEEILVSSSLKPTKKKTGKSNLKKSGERSRAILALLLQTKQVDLFYAPASKDIVLPVSVCLSLCVSVCPKLNVKTFPVTPKLSKNNPLLGHGVSQTHLV